jgi:hypothetical protein
VFLLLTRERKALPKSQQKDVEIYQNGNDAGKIYTGLQQHACARRENNREK